jgi:hypothetical protein
MANAQLGTACHSDQLSHTVLHKSQLKSIVSRACGDIDCAIAPQSP